MGVTEEIEEIGRNFRVSDRRVIRTDMDATGTMAEIDTMAIIMAEGEIGTITKTIIIKTRINIETNDLSAIITIIEI